MEFSIKFGIVKSGWSIVYIEGSQVIITKKYCICFRENQFYISKQCIWDTDRHKYKDFLLKLICILYIIVCLYMFCVQSIQIKYV